MDEKRLAEIKQRAEAATPGPLIFETWDFTGENLPKGTWLIGNSSDCQEDYRVTTDHLRCGQPNSDASTDAEFITHAREDIPYLIGEIEQLTAKLAYIESFVEDQRLSVDETYAQIFRFLKGGE